MALNCPNTFAPCRPFSHPLSTILLSTLFRNPFLLAPLTSRPFLTRRHTLVAHPLLFVAGKKAAGNTLFSEQLTHLSEMPKKKKKNGILKMFQKLFRQTSPRSSFCRRRRRRRCCLFPQLKNDVLKRQKQIRCHFSKLVN